MTIKLRDVSTNDIPAFFEHMQDPVAVQMAAYTTKDPTELDGHTAHWQKLLADDTIIKRSIVLNDELVGHIASWVQDGEREVTYWIGSDHWGQGIATAALRVFVAEVDARPPHARAAADNAASDRVLKKCGFAVVGEDRWFANARSEEIDELVYRLD